MNRNVIEFPMSPSARKPRSRRVPNSRHRAPAACQGGRARTRLSQAVPCAAIAVGWALAFAMILVPMEAGVLTAAKVLAIALFGFAVGWLTRDEAGEI